MVFGENYSSYLHSEKEKYELQIPLSYSAIVCKDNKTTSVTTKLLTEKLINQESATRQIFYHTSSDILSTIVLRLCVMRYFYY